MLTDMWQIAVRGWLQQYEGLCLELLRKFIIQGLGCDEVQFCEDEQKPFLRKYLFPPTVIARYAPRNLELVRDYRRF